MNQQSQEAFFKHLQPQNVKLIWGSGPMWQSQGKAWRINNRVMQDYDLFICLSGEAEFKLGEKSHRLRPKQGLLVPPKTPIHAQKRGKNNFEAVAQHFFMHIFSEIDLFSIINYRPRVKFSNWHRVKQNLFHYLALSKTNQNPFLRYGLFYSIVAEFIYEAFGGVRENPGFGYDFVINMLQILQDSLSEQNVLEKATRLSPYGYDHTANTFKRYIGMRPKKYLMNLRLSNAKQLLRQNFAVKEAALLSGFKDELYFSKYFKKREGLSPSAFKVSIEKNGEF